MKIGKGDFVEIEYTGRIKDDNRAFDTTDEKLAKEEGIHSEKTEYGPVVVCIGEKHLLTGLDEQVSGKELGSYTITLKPEQAFGKRSAKLIQLISTAKFTKQGIRPEPGMQIIVDNLIGTVKSVTGGRTVVDFNHLLAGRELVYEISLKRRIEDEAEKAKALLKMEFHIKGDEAKVEEGRLVIKKEVPEELKEQIKERVMQLTKIKNVEFESKTEDLGSKT